MPSRWAGRRAAQLGLLGALGALSCALPSARWYVPSGAEQRFRESQRACHQLTDNTARYEDCMYRRGFERESLWQRTRRAITGD